MDLFQDWERMHGESLTYMLEEHLNYVDETSAAIGLEHIVKMSKEQPQLPNNLDVRPKQYDVLTSITGDDKSSACNSELFCVAAVWAPNAFLHAEISWKDVGISPYVSNYAEEWIFTPLSALTTWTAAHKSTWGSVPFVLDSVKLKLLSAVRKQSLNDVDLESKTARLWECSKWVHKKWMTKLFHELAKAFALSVFDFSDTRASVLLFKEEGGCGGNPPFDCTETARCMLHYSNKGRGANGVLGCMSETTRLHNFEMSPQDSIFLRMTHLAQNNPQLAAEVLPVLHEMRKTMSNVAIKDWISSVKGKEMIPETLMEKGIEIHPDDITIGSLLGRLRNMGLILSSDDVRVMLAAENREQALRGTTPMGVVLKEQEKEVREARKLSSRMLSDIYAPQWVDYSHIGGIDNDWYQDVGVTSQILENYYEVKNQYWQSPSSFCYEDGARFFLTEDIKDHIQREERGELLRSLLPHIYREDAQIFSFVEVKKQSLSREQAQGAIDYVAGLRGATRETMLSSPFPLGLATDDSRIAHNIVRFWQGRNGWDTAAAILVTRDINMVRAFKNAIGLADKKLKLFVLDQKTLLEMELNPDYRKPVNAEEIPGLQGGSVALSRGMKRKMEKELLPNQPLGGLEARSQADLSIPMMIEYDVPNIERWLFTLKITARGFSYPVKGWITNKEYQVNFERGRTLAAQSFPFLRDNSFKEDNERNLVCNPADDHYFTEYRTH